MPIETKSQKITLDTGVFQITLVVRSQIDKSRGVSDFRTTPLRPLFIAFFFNQEYVSNDLLDVIATLEILRSFANNKLVTGKVYSVRTLNFKLVIHNDAPHLKAYSHSKSTYLDKTECMIHQAKIAKIIGPCSVYESTDL